MLSRPLLRVLLVAPQSLGREVLQEMMYGLGVDCVLAGHAAKALWKLCCGHYDVVVLAARLADMHGPTAARVIRDGGAAQPLIIGLAEQMQVREAFFDAGADKVLPPTPDLDVWTGCLKRIHHRTERSLAMDMAALEAWRALQGDATYDAVVQDFLVSGAKAMRQLRRQMSRGEAGEAAKTTRILASHSRVVGARGLARACEDLEASFVQRNLKAARGQFWRVQDDWLRVRAVLEPQEYSLAV